MTPIIWPTLDSGIPSWVRADLRAMPPSYVRKVPARTALRPGAGVVPLGFAAHRRNHTCSIAILVLVAVIALRRKR